MLLNLILSRYLVDFSAGTSWLNLKLSISQFWMKHRKLKSPFQPLKVTGSLEKWAIVSWFPFGLFVVNLLLYNINIEKKTELRQWSYHFQDLEVSFHTDDHVIFFLGYSTKVSFFSFFLFFDLLRYPHSFYSLGVTSMLYSQQYHPWIKL